MSVLFDVGVALLFVGLIGGFLGSVVKERNSSPGQGPANFLFTCVGLGVAMMIIAAIGNNIH